MSDFNKLEKMGKVFEYWCGQPLKVIAKAVAKKKKTPKGQNRGDVCFPANSKHNKGTVDKFPINNENQARNALSRAGQFDKAPPWFVGSLEELKNIVRRKVHSKYPSIGKEDKKKSKKSALEILVEKYGTDETTSITKTASPQAFFAIVNQYEGSADCVKDFVHGMKLAAEQFARESDIDSPKDRRIYDILLKGADVVFKTVPELEALDQELEKTFNMPDQDKNEEV
jgi:hypothetical protein